MDPTLGMREEFHDALLRSGSTCDGADDCRRAVRRQIARGVDVIKIATTGGVNSRIGLGLGAQMFEDEARAIVETAHLYGKKVAVHAHGADGINLALRVGADSIEHGTLLDDESIRLFRQSRRLLRADAFHRERLSRAAARQSQRLYRRGPRRRSNGGSGSPARRCAAPSRPASGSPSAPTPASRCTAATPTNSC